MIPVPANLYYSGTSQPNTPARGGNRATKRPAIPPWQGVLFVRNEESPYYGAVLRLTVEFISARHASEYLPGADSSSGYFPVVRIDSLSHLAEHEHEAIARHCLAGVLEEETASRDTSNPGRFSRALYALNRLVEWVTTADASPQAYAVAARTRSSANLFDNERDTSDQPEGSNLIQFADLGDPDLYGAVRKLIAHSGGRV